MGTVFLVHQLKIFVAVEFSDVERLIDRREEDEIKDLHLFHGRTELHSSCLFLSFL